MNSEQVKIIEDTPDKCIIEGTDGKRQTLHKIDMEEIRKSHIQSVLKVAEALSGDDLHQILTVLTNVLNNKPNVDEYLEMAENISSYLKRIYDQVGSPNLFWHPIKNIDPDIYGRAQYFTQQINDLFQQMVEVAKAMENLGKIKDFTCESENREITIDELPKKQTEFYVGVNFSFVI